MVSAMVLALLVGNSTGSTLEGLKLPVTQRIVDQWATFGSAQLHDQIVLTKPTAPMNKAQRGAIWSRLPFPYRQNWEVVLTFKVTGPSTTAGEGMALWLSETPNELGPVFGSRDNFKGLALVFDTNDDDKLRNNPSISAHFFNGTTSYKHSDDGLSTQIAGCIADFRKRDNAVAVKMSYRNGLLGVYVDLPGNGVFRRCLEKEVVLGASAPWYVGVSGETLPFESQDVYEIESLNMSGDKVFSEPAAPAPAPAPAAVPGAIPGEIGRAHV